MVPAVDVESTEISEPPVVGRFETSRTLFSIEVPVESALTPIRPSVRVPAEIVLEAITVFAEPSTSIGLISPMISFVLMTSPELPAVTSAPPRFPYRMSRVIATSDEAPVTSVAAVRGSVVVDVENRSGVRVCHGYTRAERR